MLDKKQNLVASEKKWVAGTDLDKNINFHFVAPVAAHLLNTPLTYKQSVEVGRFCLANLEEQAERLEFRLMMSPDLWRYVPTVLKAETASQGCAAWGVRVLKQKQNDNGGSALADEQSPTMELVFKQLAVDNASFDFAVEGFTLSAPFLRLSSLVKRPDPLSTMLELTRKQFECEVKSVSTGLDRGSAGEGVPDSAEKGRLKKIQMMLKKHLMS